MLQGSWAEVPGLWVAEDHWQTSQVIQSTHHVTQFNHTKSLTEASFAGNWHFMAAGVRM